jgi:hypothetical protein
MHMTAIRIRKTIDSETLHLPELRPLVGQTVDITISATSDAATREQFYRLLEQVPQSEEAWAERMALLRSWRSDSRFEPYWSAIDDMLTVTFEDYRRRAAVIEDIGELADYDFEAFYRQRDYDLKHATDHLP